MRLKVLKRGEFHNDLALLKSRPTMVVSARRSITFSYAAKVLMNLVPDSAMLFAEDQQYPGDLYIKPTSILDPDAFPLQVSQKGARIRVRDGAAFCDVFREKLGLDPKEGWSFPISAKSQDGWYAIGVKQPKKTVQRGGKKRNLAE